jgi:DNA adenine methylase
VNLRRSPLFYVGDKFKLASQILPLFPGEIELFAEPFAGGASIAINVQANKFVINDANSYVANLHKWLLAQRSVDDLLAQVKLRLHQLGLKSSFFGDVVSTELQTEHPKTYFAKQNKEPFQALRASFNSSDKSNMLDFYILLIFGFNRMIRFNASGDFNVPVGNVDFNKNVASALEGYLDWAKSGSVQVQNLDYRKSIEKMSLNQSSLIYFDPPYLIAQTEYNKGWGEKDEVEFLELLDGLSRTNIRWALSNVLTYRGLKNDLLETFSRRYDVSNLRVNYINYHDNSDKKPGEILVRNYD